MIPDLATSVQCLNMYMAMVTAKEPARTKNLLAYQAVIAVMLSLPNAARNFDRHHGWSVIKIFGRRQQRQGLKTGAGAAISPESWCRQCHSINHSSEACPSKPSSVSGKTRLVQQTLALPATHTPFPPSRKRPPPHSNPSHAGISTCTLGTVSLERVVSTNTAVISVVTSPT